MATWRDNIIPIRRPRLGEPTFKELAEDWLSTEGAQLAFPENERRHIDHLRPIWDLTERDLRPSVVKGVLGSLLRPRGPLGPSTVNKIRGTGKRIIRAALEDDRWSGSNPFEVVRRQRQTKPTHRTLTLGEARQLLPELRPDRRREALVLLYLGLRPGELKALRREDVDLGGGTIHIHRSNGRDSTKTGKERIIPIPDRLRPVLEEALRSAPASSRLVFPNKKGERQRSDTKLSRTLHDALRRAGLVTGYVRTCPKARGTRRGCGYEDQSPTGEAARCPQCGMTLVVSGVPIPVRWYDLRHSCATLHRRAGADPLAIQITLGHAPESLTDSLYTHLTVEDIRRELNKLEV